MRRRRTGSPPCRSIGDWLNEQWTTNFGHPGGIGELIQLVSGANIGSIYRGVLAAGGSAFGLLLTLLFMMIALFFAYRDGERFAGQIDRLGERILPTRWERISRVVPATISLDRDRHDRDRHRRGRWCWASPTGWPACRRR